MTIAIKVKQGLGTALSADSGCPGSCCGCSPQHGVDRCQCGLQQIPGDSWARVVPAGRYGHELVQATGPRPWCGVFNDLDVTRWSSPKKTLEPQQKTAIGWGGREKPSSSVMSPAETFGVGKVEMLPCGKVALHSVS